VHGRDSCCAPSEKESFVRDLRYPFQVLVLIYDVRSLLATQVLARRLGGSAFLTKLYGLFRACLRSLYVFTLIVSIVLIIICLSGVSFFRRLFVMIRQPRLDLHDKQ
jgi:hypothetical protein